MLSWGPDINSFEAFNMSYWYFVQHTSPLKRHYWYFIIQPSGPPSGSRRCWNMECWGPNIHSFEAISMNFGYLVNILALWIDIIVILWYHLQGQLEAESVAKCSSVALSINSLKLLTWIFGILDTTLRLKKMLENEVLKLWHPQFWSF